MSKNAARVCLAVIGSALLIRWLFTINCGNRAEKEKQKTICIFVSNPFHIFRENYKKTVFFTSFSFYF